MRPQTIIIVTINAIVILSLGVCYLEGLKFLLSEISFEFSSLQPWPAYLKMSVTGGSAFVSCVVIFLFNRFVTRQNMIHLGISCSMFAYGYFMVWKVWPKVLQLVVSVLVTPYSLFAMLSFIGLPLLFGYLLRNNSMRGLGLILEGK